MYYKPLEPNEARQNKIKGRKFKAGRCIIGMRKGLTFFYIESLGFGGMNWRKQRTKGERK